MMTHNQFIICDNCGQKIRLRIQFDHQNIPFNLECPDCKTHIFGTVLLNQSLGDIDFNIIDNPQELYKLVQKHFSFDIKNASLTQEFNTEELHYVAELSIEMPIAKIQQKKNIIPSAQDFDKEYTPTPFMRQGMRLGQSFENTMKSIALLQHRVSNWHRLKSYHELYDNGKFDLLYKNLRLLGESYNKINNPSDALSALYELMIFTYYPMTPKNYLESSSRMLGRIKVIQDINQSTLLAFVKRLQDSNLFQTERKKFLKIADKIFSQVDKLLPIISLTISGNYERLDQISDGISTITYEELKTIYENTYEFVLEFIQIIAGLNNLIRRDSPDKFKSSNMDLDKFNMLDKGQRFNHIEESEHFSFIVKMNSDIRNAIAHFAEDINYKTQLVTFTNTNLRKEKKTVVELYFIDFAKLCLENFYYACYINRVYTMLELINLGK